MVRTLYRQARAAEEEDAAPLRHSTGPQQQSRVKKLALLALAAAVVIQVSIFLFRRRRNMVESWPFSVEPTVMVRGKYGNAYVLDLSTKLQKKSRKMSESRYHYQQTLGSPKLSRGFLSLYRSEVYWIKPRFCLGLSDLPMETVFLIGKDARQPQKYRLILPLIVNDGNGFTTASLQVSADNLILSSETGGTVGLYTGLAEDPYDLIRDGVHLAVQLAPNFEKPPLPPERRLPQFCQTLGWCTWNAFGINIDGDSILDSLAWMKEQSIPVRWMILDDGWQSTSAGMPHLQRLTSLGVNQTKFPAFAETIQKIKNSTSIEYVLAWHAFSGYWRGIQPPSERHDVDLPVEVRLPKASLFFPEFSLGIHENDPYQEWDYTSGIGEAENATEFFGRYHGLLHQLGIDGVKVDVQAIVGILKPPSALTDPNWVHRHELAATMSSSLSSSVQEHFDSRIIHCMSHAPEFFYRIPHLYPSKPIMRASFDFYPQKPESHGPMITALAYNSLLFQHLAVPDWDMFQTMLGDFDGISGAQVARLHAMARSISGGPIYISDAYQKSNATLLQEAVCSDGTALPARDVALPIRSHLLQDPASRPLVVFNANGEPKVTSGVLGIFNLVYGATHDASLSISASDVEEFRSNPEFRTSFVAVSYNTKKTRWLKDMKETAPITVPPESLWCDIWSIIPVSRVVSQNAAEYDVVPLGISSKFNGAGAVLRVETSAIQNATVVRLAVRGCGVFVSLVRLRNRSKFNVLVRLNDLVISHNETDFGNGTELNGLEGQGFVQITCKVPPESSPEKEQWITYELTA